MATIPEERNALAELADELERFSAENKGLFERRNHLTLHKSSRIIKELAKVQDEEAALFSMKYINPDEARRIVRQREGNCILKCRAIAEEGANND